MVSEKLYRNTLSMVNETDPIKMLQLVEISSKIALIICLIEHVVSST